MAKLKIFEYPDVVLTQKAKPIAHVDRSYFKIADDMLETMYDAPGIGLAANQVGLLERIVVVDVDYDTVELEDGQLLLEEGVDPQSVEVIGGHHLIRRKPIILINPEIIHREGDIAIQEGCLSVPEYQAEVDRSRIVKVQYQDIDGITRMLNAEELLAVCIQHELDHLDGKLFIDRLTTIKRDLARRKLLKARKEREKLGL